MADKPKCANCGCPLNVWDGVPSHYVRHIRKGVDMGCGYPDKDGKYCGCEIPKLKLVERVIE